MSKSLPRIVCVVGPTSSGKTALGLRLAKKFHGEIINADSRQIYKEFSIGTGKPVGQRGVSQGHRAFIVKDVPHYLMDFLEPMKTFTVIDWREKAVEAIKGITKRGNLPLIVGGTGLYITSLVDNFDFPKVEPNLALREAFAEKPLAELVKVLLKIDPAAEQLVDLKNPRRVVRALEVATFTGKPFTEQKAVARPQFDVFQVGIRWSREDLYARINDEVESMVNRGWPDEIRRLLEEGVSITAPAMSSIGYREMLQYVQGTMTLEKALEATKQAVRRYAKKQESWFKRDIRIRWVKNEAEGVELVAAWLKE